MEVLVINCGSSSLKFQLIDSDSEKVLAKGICERIGIKGSVITYQPTGGEKEVSNIDMPTHHEAIDAVIKALTNKETGVIDDMSEVKAVGHRVVHGGEYFSKATLVDDDVIKKIEECNYLAPLHNPANIIGIKACMKLMLFLIQLSIRQCLKVLIYMQFQESIMMKIRLEDMASTELLTVLFQRE